MFDLLKEYCCDVCGFKKYYICAPDLLSNKRNIIAANCPECNHGRMIINFDNVDNFNDNFMERYYDNFFETLNPVIDNEGGLIRGHIQL